MTEVLMQLVFSFIAAAGFGFIFNAPRKMIIYCGFVGMTGWILYWSMVGKGIDPVQASFMGGFTVSVCSYLLARLNKVPIIIFIVSGIIPLVPGGTSYDAMRHVVSNHYAEAIPLTLKAFIISSAIAMGLVFAELIITFIRQMYIFTKEKWIRPK